jgi:hypothetical protein
MNANNILYETALKQYDTVAEMLHIEDGIRGAYEESKTLPYRFCAC